MKKDQGIRARGSMGGHFLRGGLALLLAGGVGLASDCARAQGESSQSSGRSERPENQESQDQARRELSLRTLKEAQWARGARIEALQAPRGAPAQVFEGERKTIAPEPRPVNSAHSVAPVKKAKVALLRGIGGRSSSWPLDAWAKKLEEESQGRIMARVFNHEEWREASAWAKKGSCAVALAGFSKGAESALLMLKNPKQLAAETLLTVDPWETVTMRGLGALPKGAARRIVNYYNPNNLATLRGKKPDHSPALQVEVFKPHQEMLDWIEPDALQELMEAALSAKGCQESNQSS